ncbi:hypothetical protein [Patulibacter sp.]|uniref:hypothetical protein n=1 Tax=Patulibacter sp. TaxID=1912859 RepID=UPI00271835C4|nr:hypothetical protein [Patulibacter sp.]MDO9409805.1 hypothetical protein [Patulibacter sp.]
MSSFFDLPPAEPEQAPPPHPRYRSKPWHGPPPAVVPAIVAVERVLARTDEVAVAVPSVEVYPEGLRFEIVAFARPQAEHRPDSGLDPMLFHHRHVPGAVPDEVLRIGVAFADGRRATNLETERGPGDPPASGIVLRGAGGGGNEGRYAQELWVWPVPDEGPLTIVCEWPAHGIPVTRLDVDGDVLRDAARRAQVVFSEDHLPAVPEPDPGDRGWSAYVPRG